MPVTLTLPATSTQAYYDQVRIYKRVNATSIPLLDTVSLGIASYEDPAGVINDEYHITFYSSSLGVESLPSNIYRVLTPWKQGMGVVLELQTTSVNPTVDTVGIYRRRFSEAATIRIDTVPLGTTHYYDATGVPGDEYHTTFIDSLTLAESQPGPSVIADASSGLVVVTGFSVDVRARPVTTGPGSPDAPFDGSAFVHVTLMWPSRHLTPSANGQAVTRETYKVPIYSTGTWSVPLVPNDLLQAPDSYYEFKFTDGVKYFKRIETANGAAQNFSLLADVNPLELR